MATMELYFPTAIWYEDDIFSEEQNLIWKDHSLGLIKNNPDSGKVWPGGVYTTYKSPSYDILDDGNFYPLIEQINKRIHLYAEQFNSFGEYNLSNAWLNISSYGSHHSQHTHPNNIISAVYYITAPEESGDITFSSPLAPDMLPLKDITERNHLSREYISYTPKGGRLLIFRSWLRHAVEDCFTHDPRISIAFNYK